MKVVINKCYGGFGLSHKAIMRYAELKNIKIYAFVSSNNDYGNNNYELYDEEKYQNTKGIFARLIYYSTNSDPKELNNYYFDEGKISRNDPVLIKIIEELKKEANGPYAKLQVIEIPDDVSWEIEEYDGIEWISETHQTWG